MNPRLNTLAEVTLSAGGVLAGVTIALAGETTTWDQVFVLGALTGLLGVACALLAFPRQRKDQP